MSEIKGPWDPDPSDNKKAGGRRSRASSKADFSDPDFLLQYIQKMFKQFFGSSSGGGGGKVRFMPLVFIVLVLWGLTGFYRVQPNQQGVVLRFGRLVRVADPGLNIRFPYPIETAVVRDVTSINRTDNVGQISLQSLGSYYPATQMRTPSSSQGHLILTGDENIVVVRFTVLWTIKSLPQFLFSVRNPEETIRATASSVIREIVAQMPIALVLTKGRSSLNQKAQEHLQKLLDSYKVGVRIHEVMTGRIDPPDAVIEAYRDVQKAKADAERSKNDAQSYANRVLPEAQGKAQQIIQKAEGEKQEMIALAEGEVEQFRVLVPFFKDNYELTSRLLRLRTIPSILKRTPKVVLGGKGRDLPLLQFLPPPLARPLHYDASKGEGELSAFDMKKMASQEREEGGKS